MGKPVKVLKSDNISEIENGTYIHCKELNKGLMKKDFGPLGISIQTFENVITTIESKDLSFLEEHGLDSVLFGANREENQGEIIESNRRTKFIIDTIKNLPAEEKTTEAIDIFLNSQKGLSKFFRR